MSAGRARACKDKRRGPRAPVAALAALWMAWSNAAAASSPAEIALADVLFREARAHMDAGRVGDACRKFAESQRLDPATGTLLNLGICHEREGKFATAWVELNDARAAAVREGRRDRAEIATEHLVGVERNMPKLTIVVPSAADVPDLEITYDGIVLARIAWGTPLPVDSGPHTIVANARGMAQWSSTVTMRAGAQTEVRVPALAPLPMSTTRKAAYVVGTSGLVTLAAGGVAGLVALARNRDSVKGCTDNACNVTGKAARDDAQLAGSVATALFVAAGVQLVATVILLLPSGVDRAPAASVPYQAPPQAQLWNRGISTW